MPFPVSIPMVKVKLAVLVAYLRGRSPSGVTYGDLAGLYVAEDLTLPDTVVDDFMPLAPKQGIKFDPHQGAGDPTILS